MCITGLRKTKSAHTASWQDTKQAPFKRKSDALPTQFYSFLFQTGRMGLDGEKNTWQNLMF
jgi:hypothetical protein